MANKLWFDYEIRKLIETSDVMVMRSVLKLYECQTRDERLVGETKHHNGVGFSACDAGLMSSYAHFINNGGLTKRQIEEARRRLLKYVKQLTTIANTGLPRVEKAEPARATALTHKTVDISKYLQEGAE